MNTEDVLRIFAGYAAENAACDIGGEVILQGAVEYEIALHALRFCWIVDALDSDKVRGTCNEAERSVGPYRRRRAGRSLTCDRRP